MSDPRDEEDTMLAEARSESPFRAMAVQQDVIPPGMSLTTRQVADLFGAVQVAQLVPVPRNVEHLMKKMSVLAAQFGDKYVYSWDVKKKGGGVDTIEGGTVDLAYDLAREYGNNTTDVRALDFPAYIEFYARFTDLETGYSTTRAFRQRKNQTAGGRMDADRQLDITYQIGQSKAIRNVTLKALSSFAEYCIEEAKRGMYDKIKKDPPKYVSAIERGLEKFGIALKDVERQVSRVKKDWTVRDIANVFAKLKSIEEGMANATEVFPKEDPTMPKPDQDKGRDEHDDAQNADAATTRSGNSTGGQSDKAGSARPSAASEENGGAVGRSEAKSTGKSPASDQTPKETKAEPKNKKAPAKRPGALFEQE